MRPFGAGFADELVKLALKLDAALPPPDESQWNANATGPSAPPSSAPTPRRARRAPAKAPAAPQATAPPAPQKPAADPWTPSVSTDPSAITMPAKPDFDAEKPAPKTYVSPGSLPGKHSKAFKRLAKGTTLPMPSQSEQSQKYEATHPGKPDPDDGPQRDNSLRMPHYKEFTEALAATSPGGGGGGFRIPDAPHVVTEQRNTSPLNVRTETSAVASTPTPPAQPPAGNSAWSRLGLSNEPGVPTPSATPSPAVASAPPTKRPARTPKMHGVPNQQAYTPIPDNGVAYAPSPTWANRS